MRRGGESRHRASSMYRRGARRVAAPALGVLRLVRRTAHRQPTLGRDSQMRHASFRPCPHREAPLAYLEGTPGAKMDPQCPRCRKVVTVAHATFLMADHSRAAFEPKTPSTR